MKSTREILKAAEKVSNIYNSHSNSKQLESDSSKIIVRYL